MATITIRWAGPNDATSGSTYKIERTTDNASWTTLAASQAATSPYVSDTTTLAANTTYGDATISLASATAFPTAGYMWLDDALVQWTGKSGDNLTGCIWHSGYGTYAAGSTVYEAHESCVDTVVITAGAVVYRITHTSSSGIPSAPGYICYYDPPQPESSDHCVVVVAVATDLGVEAREGISIQAYLAADTQFDSLKGAHLDAGQSANKTQTTNVFGLAFFQCQKNVRRVGIADAIAAYTFVLDSDGAGKLTTTIATIPNRDWVLLSQIV